jgi:predicted glycogen debranching enzyme
MEEYLVSRSGMGDRSYFLASDRAFFHRFCNSGFRNKWTGFWADNLKLLEFFAVRVGDNWLSPDNCEKVRYDGSRAIHHYSDNGVQVKEIIFCPEGSASLVIEITSSKDAEIEIQLAANIRRREENLTSRKYSMTQGRNSLVIDNGLGAFSADFISDNVRIIPGQEYKRHSPSGEAQSFFVPGKILMKGKSAVIILTAGKKKVVVENNYRNLFAQKWARYKNLTSGKMRSDSKALERCFSWSLVALELLKKKVGSVQCLYAGLPWFQQFWGRDVFWSLPAVIDSGNHVLAKEIIEYFSELSKKGKIPNFASLDETAYNSIDATPLWIISLEHYVRHSGDMAFLKKISGKLEECIEFLFSRDSNMDYYVDHDEKENETWMDTLNRKTNAVEVQALYFGAMRSAIYLIGLLEKEGDGRSVLIEKIVTRMDYVTNDFTKSFYADGFYFDRIDGEKPDRTRTANALVPIICGLDDHSNKILDNIESGAFTTRKGIRTRASSQPGFDPDGYHTGSVWSLTTGWAAAAEFLSGRTEKGWSYLKKLLEEIDQDALGCVGECWTGEGKLTGCGLQLWGSAFVIRVVDEFMLGIRPDAPNNRIYVSPQLPKGISHVEREIRLGTKKIRLSFRKEKDYVFVTHTGKGVEILRA